MNKRSALFTAVALSAGFVAQSASAELINEWSYTVDSTFSAFTFTSGTGSPGGDGGNAVLGGSTEINWGSLTESAATEQSSLTITSDVDSPPNLVTNGDPEDGALITHDNNIIDASSAKLDTFQISTQLNLTAADPANGTTQTLDPITFDSFFTETFNENDSSDCFAGSTSSFGCDDIFVLTNADGGPNPLLSQQFTTGGYRYTVFLDLTGGPGGTGLQNLSDEQCSMADADAGCVGFLTEEQNENSLQSRFSIEATEVPEPGTLALLGLGLVGAGYARRRQNKS